MKVWIVSLLLVLACPALGKERESLCPEILAAANIETGLSLKDAKEFFDAFDQSDLNRVIPDASHAQAVLSAGEGRTRYRVSIEEWNPKTSVVAKKMNIDCTLVKDWKLDILPKPDFRKGEGVVDSHEPRRIGLPQTFTRNGLRLVKLFDDSDQYLSISLLWELHQRVGRVSLDLPAFVTSTRPVTRQLIVDRTSVPVRGLRLSTTGSFGNVWYLVTEGALARIGDLTLLPPATQGMEGGKIASIDFLDYFDTLNGRHYPCGHVLAKTEVENCFAFNASLNPDLLQAMEEGKPIWVQLIVKLDKGYLVQTYVLQGEEGSEPKLTEQIYSKDLSEFQIPAELLP